LSQIILVAQTKEACLPEGITFTTQAQIDSFAIIYPNCTEIEGDVLIGGWNGSDITNLNGLIVLTSIGGNLEILGTSSLTSLTGLDNLTSIPGSLFIAGNAALTSLAGLDNIIAIGNYFQIFIVENGTVIGNSALISLSGLESLASIGGSALIGGSDVLRCPRYPIPLCLQVFFVSPCSGMKGSGIA